MSTSLEQIIQLEAAIANLEAQRAILGDSVIELALAPLRQQLAGLRLTPPSSLTPLDLEGERKLVTVMFADISGFTAISEKLDPEQVRSLMNGCFDHLVPVVKKYGGWVDKFIGDAILTLFGAPIAYENHAERALRAALEMMDRLTAFNVQHNTSLGLHLGINTGLVVAGGIGSQGQQQYSVMGDTVNLAARLEDVSGTGQILVGPNTYHLTARLFEFETLSPIRVKGKSELVPIYQLLSLKAAPGPRWGIEGLRSSLVGRDTELAQLQTAVRALQVGQGSTIALIGEAGLGKSRLVAEVRQALISSLTWAEGRALSYTEGMSYWIARDLLSALIGVGIDTPLPEVGTALRKSVERLFPEQAQATEIYPYLARLLNVPLDEVTTERGKYLTPEIWQGRMLQAFQNYLRAHSQAQPLILVWEDLHWADPSSLHLLETLLPLTDEIPLLLLLIFRGRLEERVWDFHERMMSAYGPSYQVIHLAPLGRDESTQLIQSLLRIENLPEEIRQLILNKAEGNPFFLEELLRSLLDAGVVVLEEDKAIVTRAVKELEVPDTLQDVIAARIDRLPPESKRTLQTASVIGRVFQQRVLAYLLEQEQAHTHLDGALSELQRRELIHLRQTEALGGREVPTDLEYIFKHAVTQETAYNSLLIAHRKALHKVAAEAIEALFPDYLDELAATLAYHFERAGVADRAIHYLTRAADQANAQFALVEARDLYRRALNSLVHLPPQPRREFDLRLHLGVCTMLAGAGADEVTPEFNRCLELATDPKQRAEVHFRLGQLFHLYARNNLAAEQNYVTALNLLTEATEPVHYVTVLAHLGYLYRYQARPARAAEVLERALALGRQTGTSQSLAQIFIFLSGAYLDLGREEEALEAGKQGLALAQSSGAVQLVGIGHSFLLDIYLARAKGGREKPESALPHLCEMQRLGHECGYVLLAAFGTDGLAQYAKLVGDRDKELKAWTDSARIFRAAGLPRRAAHRAAQYGRVLLEAGLTEAAAAAFAQVHRDCGSEGGWAELLIAAMCALAGQADQAYHHVERSLTLASSLEQSRQWIQQLQADAEAAEAWDALQAIPAVASLVRSREAGQPDAADDLYFGFLSEIPRKPS